MVYEKTLKDLTPYFKAHKHSNCHKQLHKSEFTDKICIALKGHFYFHCIC